MIELTPAPSSLLKIVTSLARWSLGLVLAAWFVFGMTWGALQWLIVPRIGEFRPQLEAQATRVLGVPVHIEAIAAHSNGMIPSFELINVELFDAQGRVALRLPRVLAALSPRSLWQLGFEQLYVDRPELSIRRAQDGKIYVAGLDFSDKGNAGTNLADWFFSQTEFVIHDGTLDWTDELRSAPLLALQQVELVVRNKARQHELRLDATPPVFWGERFSLHGQLRQPLLSLHNGRWQDWEGQLYAAFPQVDLSQLRRYTGADIDLRQGAGALTTWVDVSRGQVQAVVADIALAQVSIKLGADLQALELQTVQGRLAGRALAGGFEFSTQALAFDTREGLHWPGGNISVQYLGADGKIEARGELQADKLDLAAVAQIADRLPFDSSSRAALLQYAPKGRVQRIQASWQGPIGGFSQYAVKGLVTEFELAAQNVLPVVHPVAGTSMPEMSMPTRTLGVRGASIEFDFTQSAGKASVVVANGVLDLPGVFDEAVIPVDQLSTDVKWQINGERLAVQLPNLKFSNADAQGEAQIKWETSDSAVSAGHSRFPGVLDLQGTLSRADGTRVHRYLPAMIHLPVREYVRDAVLAGSASTVRFKIKGDLNNIPFTDPKKGEFRISANVQNATFVYVPRKLQAPEALPWPALTQLSGELVFERAQMHVRGGRARMGTGVGLQVVKVEAAIPDLRHPSVTVSAQLQGPLSQALGIVSNSPLAVLTGQALGRAVATASADYKLKLVLPIAALNKSTVVGSVTLAGNDIQVTADTPKLTNIRGVVNFSEKGFSITGGQARMLGGEVRLEASSVAPSGDSGGASNTAPALLIRASGTVSAQGLREAKELGVVARMAQHASGSAAYSAVFALRRGMPELLVTSNLQGLGLSLPAPFNKNAETALPFRLETALVRESWLPMAGGRMRLRDQLTLGFGQVASIIYMRDLSGPEPRVLSGSLAVGLSPQESAPLPVAGVVANINLSVFDLDAWDRVLSQTALTSLAPADAPSASPDYWPNTFALRARELTFGGRKLSNLVLGGAREGLLWRANLEASELNGYVEYRQPSDSGAGRVYARLARLTIAPSVAQDVEALLQEQPASIPALDIIVENFELHGKQLGRLEVEAINQGTVEGAADAREWRLNKLNVVTPEAVLTASGNWASVNAQAPKLGAPAQVFTGNRRMSLDFKLNIVDGGELLTRLGMKDVVRKGRGKMEGQVSWIGSPFSLDYPSMTGAFVVNVEAGQFLKADPGISKLLGVLSLQALPRRLTLDFRDIFSEGFTFDFLRGDVTIEQGIANTNNLQMKGVNAAVLMEGQADIAHETQDIKVVVVPEINAGTASLIASVINPAIGVGTFLAQLFLRKPLMEAATQEFHMDGSWADPKIVKVQR